MKASNHQVECDGTFPYAVTVESQYHHCDDYKYSKVFFVNTDGKSALL